tara:strand:- start:252 stop:482 length:231 start_codon:yes stop_codon:yes gene_type:complete
MLLGDTCVGNVELGSLITIGVAPVIGFVETVTQAVIVLDFNGLAGETCSKYPVVVAKVGRKFYALPSKGFGTLEVL